MRICAFAAALLVVAGCATTTTSPAVIESLENRWNASRIAGDAREVASLLDDRWTMIHVDARVEGKQSYVDGIASRERQIESVDITDRTVRMLGDVAVVTGVAAQRGFRRGEMREGRLRFTHVWVRRAVEWRMIVSQSTGMK